MPQPERGEVEEALRLPSACCTECGTHLDKHDYAFFRIGRLRAEVELAMRLLNLGVSREAVVRGLEQVLMDTMSDYRPASRAGKGGMMPHDRNGVLLSPGDRVTVEFTVRAVHMTEEFCNVDLVSVETMPPTGLPTILSAINTRQTVFKSDLITGTPPVSSGEPRCACGCNYEPEQTDCSSCCEYFCAPLPNSASGTIHIGATAGCPRCDEMRDAHDRKHALASKWKADAEEAERDLSLMHTEHDRLRGALLKIVERSPRTKIRDPRAWARKIAAAALATVTP
jgi:hypothetical protein